MDDVMGIGRRKCEWNLKQWNVEEECKIHEELGKKEKVANYLFVLIILFNT
jgi:hypothetical protein